MNRYRPAHPALLEILVIIVAITVATSWIYSCAVGGAR